MAIKRTAPVAMQQSLQVSDQVQYRFKPTAASEPVATVVTSSHASFVVSDLVKTILTTLLIVAIVLVVMWQGWLR